MRRMILQVGTAAARTVPAVDVIAELLTGNEPIDARSDALEHFDAAELIEGAIAAFGASLAVSTAFGAGGLCVMHMAQQVDPDVRAFFIDTGFNFPETEDLLGRWRDERRLRVERVLPVLSAEAQASLHGDRLWARDPDRCCAIRKVEPNERALASTKLWVAALRRDEATTRRHTPVLQRVTLGSGHTLLKLCPIARWSHKDVWRYIAKHDLPYNALHDRGYPSIGCTHCTRPVGAGEDERAGRWSGQVKTECGLHVVAKPSSG